MEREEKEKTIWKEKIRLKDKEGVVVDRQRKVSRDRKKNKGLKKRKQEKGLIWKERIQITIMAKMQQHAQLRLLKTFW